MDPPATIARKPEPRVIEIRSSDPNIASKIREILDLAHIDPVAAIERLNNKLPGQNLQQDVLRIWASDNANAALQWILDFLEKKRLEAFDTVVDVMVENVGAEEALKRIQTLVPEGHEQDCVVARVIAHAHAKSDPFLAIALADELKDGSAKRLVVWKVAEHYFSEGLESEFWRLLEETGKNETGNALAHNWIFHLPDDDPVRAIDWLQEEEALFEQFGQPHLLVSLYSRLPSELLEKVHPEIAAEKALEIENDEHRERFLVSLGSDWEFQGGAFEAAEWLLGRWDRVEDGTLVPLLEANLHALIKYDEEYAFSLVKEISNPKIRSELESAANSAALKKHVRNHPESAATYLESLLEKDQPQAEKLMPDMAKSYLDYDPDAAYLWIERLPEGKTRDMGIEEIVKVAAQSWQDFEGAEAWILQMKSERKKKRLRDWLQSRKLGKKTGAQWDLGQDDNGSYVITIPVPDDEPGWMTVATTPALPYRPRG